MENILAQYNKKYPRIIGLRRSALLEMGLFFVLTLILAHFFAASPRFIDAWLHPFFIIVALIAVQYGSNEGIFCALVATILLLVGNLPERHINQDSYAWLFEVAKLPLSWLLVAVVLGELRQRHMRERNELLAELNNSVEREKVFARNYEQAKDRKERLELNIASRVRTEIGAFRAAKSVGKLDPEQVTEGGMRIVHSATAAKKFSLFLNDGTRLSKHLTQGWSETDEQNLPASYRFDDPLYQSMVVRHEIVSIRNYAQEKLLNNQGVMAAPLLDTQTNEVLGMLKIEDISFLDFGIETLEMMRALCEWIAISLSNARYYQTAMNDTTVNPSHNLMTRSFFNRYRDYITALARRLKFNVFMLDVAVANYDALSGDDRVKVARALAQTVDETLRNVDFAFDHQQINGSYGIILPATDANGAQVVRDKIERELQKITAQNIRGVRFNFSLSALHEVA